MLKKLIFFFLFITMQVLAESQVPFVSTGTIIRIDRFPSQYVTPRNIDIWLPPGYDSLKSYSVLYMHDGQMLFDSSMTWNHQSWEVDVVLGKLLKQQLIRNVIVVGIWNNNNTRHADYFPQKPFEMMPDSVQQQFYKASGGDGNPVFKHTEIRSDRYLKFIVKELKPYIDSKFSTLKKREGTFIAGSSMGGLISLYAICRYPKVFGGAACLSTHWPGIFSIENNPFPETMVNYLRKSLPAPSNHKIYFDYGTATLDSLYPPLQQKVDEVMRQKKFTGKNWMTQSFPGEDHSEKAWSKRLSIPAVFLLKREN